MISYLAVASIVWMAQLSGIAQADGDPVPACTDDATLLNVHQFCHYSGQEVQALFAQPDAGVSYRIRPMCVETQNVQPTCLNQQTCTAPPDTYKYMVLRSEQGGPFEPWGTVCLAADDADGLGAITPARVGREMRNLAWPQADLVIEPPDGRTLINLPTNFHTTNTSPTSQTITLLGQQVEIEASPVEYLWRFGDGTEQSGPDPGAAYPDLRVTHTYTQAGVTVSPSVDVTYEGRYRVEGGTWIPIPDILTVTGDPATLQVLSATPHLVG